MDIVDQVIAGALDTEASGSGSYFNYGRYSVILEELIIKKGNNGPMFIPVFYIEESQDVNEVDDNGHVCKANPAGTTASYPCNMAKKESASNARGFVLAGLQKPESGKNDPALQQLIAEKMRQWAQPGQPLRGLRFFITTTKYTNQGRNNPDNRGKTMPRLNFKLAPGQTRESVLANRAKLDAISQGKAAQQAASVAAQPAPAAPAYVAPVPVPVAPPPPAQAPAYVAPAPVSGDPFAGIF